MNHITQYRHRVSYVMQTASADFLPVRLLQLLPETHSEHARRLKKETGASLPYRVFRERAALSDPTFRAFSRPKSFWGRSRPGHLVRCLPFFSAGQEQFLKSNLTGGKTMSIIKESAGNSHARISHGGARKSLARRLRAIHRKQPLRRRATRDRTRSARPRAGCDRAGARPSCAPTP